MKIIRKNDAMIQDALEQSRKAMFVGETDEKAIHVNSRIREKYSISDEIAIIRKALAKLDLDDKQFNEYNKFVEECKKEKEHNI